MATIHMTRTFIKDKDHLLITNNLGNIAVIKKDVSLAGSGASIILASSDIAVTSNGTTITVTNNHNNVSADCRVTIIRLI